MALAQTIWVHGHSIQVEYPERGTIQYKGFSAKYKGNTAQPNWLHFAIATPLGINDKLRVGSVSLRLRGGGQAFVEAIHVYDGEIKIAGEDDMHLRPTQWEVKKVDIHPVKEIQWGLGISVLVNFGPDARWIEFSAAGADFLSNGCSNNIGYSNNVFNVRCFGARGDGTTDDSAAVKATLTAIRVLSDGMGVLKFPNGTYKVNETAFEEINSLNGLTIEGTTISEVSTEGTTIKYVGDSGKAMLFFGYSLELKALKSVNKLPEKGKNLIFIAKISNSYYVRIFDQKESKITKKGEDTFLLVPDQKFALQLEKAFQNSLSISHQEQGDIIQKIALGLNLELLRFSLNYISIKNIKIEGQDKSGSLLYTAKNAALSFLEIDRVILSHSNPKSSLISMEGTYAAHMSFRNIRALLSDGAEEVAFKIKGDRWFQIEFDNMMINMPNATKPAIHLENTNLKGGETAPATSLRRITFEETRAGAVKIRGVQYVYFEHVSTADYEKPTAPAFDIDAYIYPDPDNPSNKKGNAVRRITFMNCASFSGTEENPDIRVGGCLYGNEVPVYENEAPVLINCRIGWLDVQRRLDRQGKGRPIIIGASSLKVDEIPECVGETTIPLEILPSGRIVGVSSISAKRKPEGYSLRGTIKFSGNDWKATQKIPLSENNSYYVLLTPTCESGSPAKGSNRIKKVDKEKDEFTVYVEDPPGQNAEVSFDWLIIR